MADRVLQVVNNQVRVSVSGGVLNAALAAQAALPFALRAEAALAEIEEIASGSPDAPSILNKLDKTQNLADVDDAAEARNNIGADLAANVNLLGVGAGGHSKTLADLLNNLPVSVLRYEGVIGDGVNDDSAGIQKAIDANKGRTVILPFGYTFKFGSVKLIGPTYDGTKLVIEGDCLLRARTSSSDWTAGDFSGGSPTYAGLHFEDVSGFSLDLRGIWDGNRTNQPNLVVGDQQCHCVSIRGCHWFTINDGSRFREIRGDAIVVTTKTNVGPYVEAENSSDFYIGYVDAQNSADDGRNAVSIISGLRGKQAGGNSVKVGGVIGGSTMPGGFDIEPDGGQHRVADIDVGFWNVDTAGTSGIACIGHAITNDAARDWTNERIKFDGFNVVNRRAGIGGPIFTRTKNIKARGFCRKTTRSIAFDFTYLDVYDFDFTTEGTTNGISAGTTGACRNGRINIRTGDDAGSAFQAAFLEDTVVTGTIRALGQGVGSNGLQIVGGAIQRRVRYEVDIPYDANKSRGFLNSSTTPANFTDVTIENCAMDGWTDKGQQVATGVNLRSKNVRGRTNGTAAPTTGWWKIGDVVANDTPTVVGSALITGWQRLTESNGGGTNNAAGVDWTPIYSRTSATLTNTATYDPPSLALAASGAIQTITVTGAALGDAVSITFSNSAAGAVFHGWVSAANTVRYFVTNQAGTNPLDLGSGTVRAIVNKV